MGECIRDIHNMVLGINELRAITEPNSTSEIHHVSLRSKTSERQACATSAEDLTFSMIAQTTAAINSKPKHQHN